VMHRNPPCHFIDDNGHVICTMDLGPNPPKYYKLAMFGQATSFVPDQINLDITTKMRYKIFVGRCISQHHAYNSFMIYTKISKD